MKAINIEWDVDKEEDLDSLPREIDIPEGITDEDEISDYLSDQTGFCHKGYVLEREFADINPGDKEIEMKDVVFEERTYSEASKKWTYYFTAPASKVLEMFPGRYKPEDVVSTELSIEVPCNSKTEYEFGRLDGVVVSISPTSEDEDGCLDYDWSEIDINDSDTLWMLEKAMRETFTFEEYWNSGMIIKDLCVPGACSLCDEIIKCIAETSFKTLTMMSECYDEMEDIMRHAKQLYNRTCKGRHNEKVKPFKVLISEVFAKTVVILAESKDEAYEQAEELCNAGIIDINARDFNSRAVEVFEDCVPEELKAYEIYEKEERMEKVCN